MNVIIVHGSNLKDRERMKQGLPAQNKRHWIPWLKDELEKRGIKTFTPLMPRNWAPKYEEWKVEFEKLSVNEYSVLVGHSAGGTFLVRWLGETKKKIKKLILIVPVKLITEDYNYFKEMVNFEIDGLIKERVEEIVIFVSDDERDSIKKSVEIYVRELGGKLIELKSRGHFVQKTIGEKMEFPELLEEVLK